MADFADRSNVLLGDGEFDGSELQAFCAKQGWKYALRTAKSNLITTGRVKLSYILSINYLVFCDKSVDYGDTTKHNVCRPKNKRAKPLMRN